MSKLLRCWPGCIAVIVSDDAYLENIGRVVRVNRATARTIWDEPGFNWEVEADPPLRVGVYQDGRVRDCLGYTYLARAAVIDERLRPLLPPPGSVTETEVKELYEPLKTKEPV